VELQGLRRLGLGVVPLVHHAGVDAACGAELRDLLEDGVVGVEEEGERRRELVDVQAALDAVLDVSEAVREREGKFLDRGRSGLPDVVAGDGDGVELRRLRGAVLHDVRDEVEGGLRGDDPLLLRDELLEHVVLEGPPNLLSWDALLVGEREVHRVDDGRARVNRERRRHLVEVDAVEEDLHVPKCVDGDALLADLAEAHRVVAVEAHQRRHVEGRREPGLALVDEVVEPLVGLLGSAEASELPHRPRATAVARGIDASRVRELPGEAEVLLVVRVGDVVGRVEAIHIHVRDRREAVLPLAVGVENGVEAFLFPLVARLADVGEVVVVVHVCNVSWGTQRGFEAGDPEGLSCGGVGSEATREAGGTGGSAGCANGESPTRGTGVSSVP